MDDGAIVHHQDQAFEQRHAIELEAGQSQGALQSQPGVGKQRKRQVQPLDGFALVFAILCRKPEDPRHAQRLEFPEMIAEAAALGRAAARARDCVPAVRQRNARPAGARIDVNHGPAGQSRKIDRAAVGRRKRQIRRPHAGEVPGAAVIARHRQIRWKVQRIVEAHLRTACRPAISSTRRDINCADPARSKAASAPVLHR